MKLRIADLFCGTGGFSHGFVQAGNCEVVLGVDIRASSIATFRANHPGALAMCGDIRDLPPADVADRLGRVSSNCIDVIIGGPPCQGFSSIRPYRSINENDLRNSLFEQFVLYVRFFQPRFVVFENVVGLLHHKRGETLKQIRGAFESLGYACSHGVLNSVCYGIPQKRERVILVGEKGATRSPKLPEPTHEYNGRSMASTVEKPLPLFNRSLKPVVTLRDAIGDLPPVTAAEGSERYQDTVQPSEYAKARRKSCTKLTLHSSTRHTPRMLDIIRIAGTNRWALPAGLTTSGFSSCYSRLSFDEPATTITVNFVHPASNRCIHPAQDRALTPREGARIQSFDDDFVFCGSRTEIVKQIGEAVPPLLGLHISNVITSNW